eukprot:scaffold20312_cov185-Amphora_coffeaeformis.AAC.5
MSDKKWVTCLLGKSPQEGGRTAGRGITMEDDLRWWAVGFSAVSLLVWYDVSVLRLMINRFVIVMEVLLNEEETCARQCLLPSA